ATSLVNRVKAWISAVNSAIDNQELIGKPKPNRKRTGIAWEPGEEGWAVLNTDGSVLSDSSKAAAGGLIRNSEGRCLKAFCINLGRCSIMRAELRCIINGLLIAWDIGYQKIEACVDSRAILSLVQIEALCTHQHASEISKLLERDWVVTLSHTYREGNAAADYLANLGHSHPPGTHLIPCNFSYPLRRDCMGISEPRLIPVN
ncbi:Putative ribonuclease H protein At1g65750, partial [Linum perenne]